MAARDYDTTVARMAGNILAGTLTYQQLARIGHLGTPGDDAALAVRGAVLVARAAVAEVRRTQPGPCTRAGCGAPESSTIHAINSGDLEIAAAAHAFERAG